MASNPSRIPRLYCEAALQAGASVPLAREQGHYLVTVMRLRSGDEVRLFNGRDGEWMCTIEAAGRRGCQVVCTEKTADPQPPPDIDYLFAPLKHARLDYIVQKATELGARRLRPVMTERTVAQRVNLERMRANAMEAAEQCNLVYVPEILAPQPLARVIAAWDPARRLIFCDERAPVSDPLRALAALPPGPAALLIGPEGGFTEVERALMLERPFVTAISLGPRVIRADTAGVAALALLQAACGDWSGHQRT
jgi:16S rRNA (uracil1498-N3)-methyltransferase